MTHNYWRQKLTVLSLLVSPTQSLPGSRVSFSVSSLPPHRASDVTRPVVASGPGSRGGSREQGRRRRGESHAAGQRRRAPPLFSHGNTRETEDDFDEFMEDIFLDASVAAVAEAASVAKSETETQGAATTSPHFIQGEAAIGIGGNDGFVYDVNALKRNLVQESVRGCKQELLVLLGDGRTMAEEGRPRVSASPRWRRDRDDLIEERLSALVQANPVSTTTDSNLLDGKWSFAFETNSASTILDTSRFLLSKTKRTSPPAEERAAHSRNSVWHSRAGKTDNPFRSSTREIRLERLRGDEHAHVVDRHRVLGGLFQTSRRYDVFGLTRTALDLDPVASDARVCGVRVGGRGRGEFAGTARGRPLEIQVLYLDTDLCICTAGGLGLEGPLRVYTKDDAWVTGGAKRKLRLFAKTASWILTMQSPLRLRQRLIDAFADKNDNASRKVGPGLKAVAIGEVDLNEDGTTRESHAWDGPDDPFAHLAPGERMEVLRTMSLQDIYQSAVERKEQNKKRKRKWFGKSGRQFKRPDRSPK